MSNLSTPSIYQFEFKAKTFTPKSNRGLQLVKELDNFYKGTFVIKAPSKTLDLNHVFLLLRAKMDMDKARLERSSILDRKIRIINNQNARDHIAADHDTRLNEKFNQIDQDIYKKISTAERAFEDLQKSTNLLLKYKERRGSFRELLQFIDQDSY